MRCKEFCKYGIDDWEDVGFLGEEVGGRGQ